jgi:nucleoside-diphosphate-sugar epimerase
MSEAPVIVTGANGFIGRHLVRHFQDRAWPVRALVHRLPEERRSGVEYLPYDISTPPDDAVFQGARFLVHCAYVRHAEARDSDRANLEGTRALIGQCRQWGVKPVFLSSFSAHERAGSHYGRSKYQVESLFDHARDLVLKPGLVVGRAGLFGTIAQTIARHRWVPLAGAGRRVQTIAVDDLCLIIARGLERDISGAYRVADPAAVTLRELYEVIAAQQGRKVRLVPVPIWFVLWACRLGEAVGVRLPVSSDSVLGLKHLRTFDTTVDLRVFGVTLKSLRESLASLA